jgi:hypothetical protein
MTAEEEAWLKLSLRLHKTPSEVMHQVTWVDFLRYQVLFEEEVNQHEVLHWYMAQLAEIIFCIPFRIWGKPIPSAVETKKFLLKFGKPEPKVKDELDEIARQDAVENYSQKEMLKWALSLGMPLPGQEPEVDTSPVKTMLPPNMRGMTVKKQEDVPPGAPPVVATPAAPLPPALPEVAPAGPIGGKRRIGRGHRTDRSADGG